MANPCTVCGEPGIPGLILGTGKCQYHYNVGQFGQQWADRTRDEKFPVAPSSNAQDHPPHRLILQSKEGQALFMQVYPPGHIFNSATNPEGKVVLIGKRLGGQQRVQIRANEIDSMIEALQYAKAKLQRGET